MTQSQSSLCFPQHPAELAAQLLIGSVGRDHLARAAGQALMQVPTLDGQNRAEMGRLAGDLLLSAWTDFPLDGEMAQVLTQSRLPREAVLPNEVLDVLAAFRQFWQPPNAAHPFQAVLGPANAEARALVVQEAGVREPRNLFWKSEAWRLGVVFGLWEPARACLLPAEWPRTLAPVRLLAQAQCHLALGDPEAALASLESLEGVFPGAPDLVLRGECLERLGRRDEAVAAWADCLRAAPWRTNVLLRLHDVATGRCDQCQLPTESVALLLYSYNKAADLSETLASLVASDTGNAPLWVLDNGSTDATPQVLQEWGQRLGDRLKVVSLPVNIGAPAARNWLLSLSEVRQHGFVAFIDDDVRLPKDWLGKLGAAVACAPKASVWGCRVLDDSSPLVAQSVDISPLAPEKAGRMLVLPQLQAALPDLGQFTYLRPCVSVTGCCHLLRTADIDPTGGFDIRFSPSQCDDIERDLRLCLGGGHVVYQGNLAIGHKRRSGQAAERSAAEVGNATANTHKIETKHTQADFQKIHEAGITLLRVDLEAKQRWAVETFGG